MNRKQRVLTIIALIGFVIIGVCHYLTIDTRMVGRSPHFWESAATDDGLHAWEKRLIWIDPKRWEQDLRDKIDLQKKNPDLLQIEIPEWKEGPLLRGLTMPWSLERVVEMTAAYWLWKRELA